MAVKTWLIAGGRQEALRLEAKTFVRCSKQLEPHGSVGFCSPPCRKMGIVKVFHIEGFRQVALHG